MLEREIVVQIEFFHKFLDFLLQAFINGHSVGHALLADQIFLLASCVDALAAGSLLGRPQGRRMSPVVFLNSSRLVKASMLMAMKK